MKVKVLLKDPDGVFDSFTRSVEESLEQTAGLSSYEKDKLKEIRREAIVEACRKFIEFGEYVAIEIDTEGGTARVLTVEEANE